MNALTFQVRALAPLLVTQLGAGEENSSTAFGFIPGGVLRGVVVGHYLREHQVADAAQDPTCRRLFFDGTVRYLNAYPVNRLGQRTLPRPLSWRVSKDDRDNPSATIYDFAIELDKGLDNPVSPSEVFCWRDEGRVEIGEPGRYVNVHNASENRNVKRKEDSTVYRYEAIAAGELFGAVILAENEADLRVLRSLLNGAELNLGGSRSAGYGRVRFENVRLDPDWHEYEPDEEPDEDVVTLTLLSDAILRDENGQTTTDLDAVLGWKHQQPAYQRTRVAGGFNRKWGLPLVQTPALQAGSVFVYRADDVDRESLQQLEQKGIGERRAEGFGRIAVNWHTQTELQRRLAQPRDTISLATSLSKESRQLAEQMTKRRLQAILDQKILEAITLFQISGPKPSNAQVSRLRVVVRRAWRTKDIHLVTEHLKNLKPSARNQFERARAAGDRFLTWLVTGIDRERIWDMYFSLPQLPSIAGVEAEITPDIKTEYTLRLIDAVLQRATKESEGGGA